MGARSRAPRFSTRSGAICVGTSCTTSFTVWASCATEYKIEEYARACPGTGIAAEGAMGIRLQISSEMSFDDVLLLAHGISQVEEQDIAPPSPPIDAVPQPERPADVTSRFGPVGLSM